MADVDKRIELQHLLEGVLGSKQVYFQPGPNITMHYPAIVYSRNDITGNHADNVHYTRNISYKVTIMDYDPDSDVVEKISKLTKCAFNSHYESDGLNHDVFTIYY